MPTRPVPAVSAIVSQDNKILLVKRGHEPNKGLWSLPGGSIMFRETAVDAVAREVREETGLDIEPVSIAGIRDVITDHFHYVIITYHARVIGGELRAASDAADAQWFEPQDMDRLEMTEGLIEFMMSVGA